MVNSVSVKTDLAQKKSMGDKRVFDIMVFKEEEDYLCYVEAVLLLYRLGHIKPCAFVYKSDVYYQGEGNYEFAEKTLLDKKHKA